MVLAWAACSQSEAPVRFKARSPTPDQTVAWKANDQKTLGDWQPEGQAKRTLDFFEKTNLMTIDPAQKQTKALNDHMVVLRKAAKQLFVDDGKQAVVKLGLFLLTRFETELDKLLAASKKVPGSAEALLAGKQPPESLSDQFTAFARYGGAFLQLAAANQLVKKGPDGSLTIADENRFFIRLAFKTYWARVMPEAVNSMEWVLSPQERLWYEIWVVERSTSAPMIRKLNAIRLLAVKDPAYPVDRAMGIVLYQGKKWKPAMEAFGQALKKAPNDLELKKFLAAAKRHNK
jgi:hypothetical protein